MASYYIRTHTCSIAKSNFWHCSYKVLWTEQVRSTNIYIVLTTESTKSLRRYTCNSVYCSDFTYSYIQNYKVVARKQHRARHAMARRYIYTDALQQILQTESIRLLKALVGDRAGSQKLYLKSVSTTVSMPSIAACCFPLPPKRNPV